MRFRKFSGYALYPLLAVLLVPLASPAQDSSSQQQPASSSSSSQSQQQETTPQQRIEVLREAQARVNARRRIRIQQIIQDTYSHKFELNSGGGSLRFIPGSSLQRINEAGWMVDLTDYIRGDLGVDVDFRGYYGTAFTRTNPYSVFNPSISEYTFMAGPRYRFFKGQHWGWTAQGLVGVGHGNFGTGTNGLPPQLIGLFTDTTVLNFTPAVSVDYNFSPAIALRITGNELFTDYGSAIQKDLGGNIGIVYRFGRK
jgi:hypothetical protein